VGTAVHRGQSCPYASCRRPSSTCPARVSGGKVSSRHAELLHVDFRVRSRAYWAADMEESRPGGRTTNNNRNGRRHSFARGCPHRLCFISTACSAPVYRGHDAAVDGTGAALPQIPVVFSAGTRPTVLDARSRVQAGYRHGVPEFVRRAPVLETPGLLYWCP
jgi:hypothetical protein